VAKKNGDAAAGCCVIGLLLLALPFTLAGCWGCSKLEFGDGYRDGTIRKLSRTGLFFKTWECEVLGDGVRFLSSRNGVGGGPETFQFTVDDPAVVAAVRDLPPGVRVRVHYRKLGAAWRPSGETRYRITAVERLKRGED
jgi:hypothetical protein